MQGLAILPLVLALADAAGAPADSARAPVDVVGAPAAAAGAPADFAGAAVDRPSACVTAIRVAELSDRTRVEIDIRADAMPVVGRSRGGDGVVCGFGPCGPTLPLPDRTFDSPRVASVRVTDVEGSTEVEIAFATSEIDYRYVRVEDPPRLVVDLIGIGGTPRPRKPAAVPARPPAPSAGPLAAGSKDFMALGEEALANGEVDRGLAYLESAVALMKTTASKRDLLMRIARRARADALHAQAIRCYRRVLAMSPPETLAAWARVELGGSLAARDDVAGALAEWDSVVAIGAEPMTMAARRERADCLLAEGRGADALGDLAILARRGRDGAEEAYAGYRLGLLLAEAGRVEEALVAFEGVAPDGASDADSASAYFARAAVVRRGDLLYKSGRHDAAAAVYERVVASWGDTEDAAWALFQIANADRRAGRAEAALERYRALLDRWPDGRWAGMAEWGVDECERLLGRSAGADRASRGARRGAGGAGGS